MGKIINDIKRILKNDKIICYSCLSENIVQTYDPNKSGYTESGIKYRNHEIYCKDCEKRFMYSAILNSNEDKMFDNIIVEVFK